jgi:prolyl-tRNA synthetase
MQVPLSEVPNTVSQQLNDFQKVLYDKAYSRLKENTHIENDYQTFSEKLEARGGFYQLHWCESRKCEDKIKQETKATIRCIPFAQIRESGKCVVCQSPSTGRVIFARNY